MRAHTLAALILLVGVFSSEPVGAAGTLTPIGSPDLPIQIRDHHVDVVINNGFARTEVIQTFVNPNDHDLEAIYAFPVPKTASLSEVTVFAGELRIDGEVILRDDAERIYEEERRAGNDAALGTQNGYQSYEFRVSPVRARDQTRLRFVYYQPLAIDSGVGRYVYPLEEGGTDDRAARFWTSNPRVEGTLSVALELRSAVPVADVRVPGLEDVADVSRLGGGQYRVLVERRAGTLTRDFIFYYRLQDGLPGRVDLIPYRADESRPGHFMLVLTPGIDLAPLEAGSDTVFVLDVSGSMKGKIQTLTRGVTRALGTLRPEDRFRVVTFSSRARELTPGWVAATTESAHRTIREVASLKAHGSTNLFEGLELAVERLDDDRATSIVLITDAVTNTGVIDPRRFHQLMSRYDVRVLGFLLGNSANWPLMRAVCHVSGGFYAGVSNADDVLGQILLARSKVTHEALHDVELEASGVELLETTGERIGKVFRGQQIVLFGRYERGGRAKLKLHARITGQDKTYTTTFGFPERAPDHPEIERLFGMARVEELEDGMNAGLLDANEARASIADLGIRYQLVTDETAMLVVSDETFGRYGIDRGNRDRVAVEGAAQARRAEAPVTQTRVDRANPMFDRPAPSVEGGGAIDPLGAALALGLATLAGLQARRSRRGRGEA